MRGERGGEVGEGLPAVRGTHLQQEYLQGALTPEAKSPQQVLRRAHVIAHVGRRAARDDSARVLAQVTLEAASGDQTGIVAVGRDQDEGAGLAISRAGSVYEDAECHRAPGGALALIKREQGTERGFHSPAIMPARRPVSREDMALQEPARQQ